jgi:hypothetical protein
LKESFEGEHTAIAVSEKKEKAYGSFWVVGKKGKDSMES